MNNAGKKTIEADFAKTGYKCLVVPEELEGVRADFNSAPSPVQTEKRFTEEEEEACDVLLAKYLGFTVRDVDFSNAKTYTVRVSFNIEEKERMRAAFEACGYEGVTDWLRTCKMRLIMQYAAMNAERD